jgi:hypothetical protein
VYPVGFDVLIYCNVQWKCVIKKSEKLSPCSYLLNRMQGKIIIPYKEIF